MTETELKSTTLGSVADVDIDDEGVFKYVLMHVTDPISGESKTVVRGFNHCEFHDDVFCKASKPLEALGLKVEERGGGRIEHHRSKGTCFVYGYSMAFGRAKHGIAVQLIQQAYPEHTSVSFSNEGY
eukprot:m.108049 g.108049  ORF g.108049 m.108049 type:complete len:127 (-) comp9184_c8_seq1:1955-2335(-)